MVLHPGSDTRPKTGRSAPGKVHHCSRARFKVMHHLRRTGVIQSAVPGIPGVAPAQKFPDDASFEDLMRLDRMLLNKFEYSAVHST